MNAKQRKQTEQANKNIVQTMTKAKELCRRRGYDLKKAIPVAKRYTRMFPAK